MYIHIECSELKEAKIGIAKGSLESNPIVNFVRASQLNLQVLSCLLDPIGRRLFKLADNFELDFLKYRLCVGVHTRGGQSKFTARVGKQDPVICF